MEESPVETLVLDASVIVKWFAPEEDTEQAIAIRDQLTDGQISVIAPDLLAYEIANALRHNRALTPAEAEEAAMSIFTSGIKMVVPVRLLLNAAFSLSSSLQISVYDAAYLALAQHVQCTFITADRKFFEKAKHLPGVQFLGGQPDR